MDPELADLAPLFAQEARDRLERLAGCLPRLEGDVQAAVEARRELHTLKGAGRMLRIGAVAELCHAAEGALAAPGPGRVRLLARAVERLAEMVETVARGAEPRPDPELLELLRGEAR